MRKTLTTESFKDRVHVNANDCWIWQGAVKNPGTSAIAYGWLTFMGKQMNAHRASWVLHRGQIPDGMFVCHTCDVPLCVNPDHLFLGTQSDNMKDMWAKGRHRKINTGGSGSGRAKLTLEQALRIKEMSADGVRQSELARLHGVTQSAISRLVTGRNWSKHV